MLMEKFSINLVLIPLRVIIEMYWLGPNRAMIDCERQLVRVHTPSGAELVIHGERTSHGTTLYSFARDRILLQ